MMTVRLIAHTPEPEKVVAAAAKLCYSDAHITDLLDGLTEEKTAKFLTMLSDLGHASPIEHASFTFGIEGVSRTLLAQITRHRIASFSVQSQRYVRLDDFRYVIPPEIEAIPEAKEAFIASMSPIPITRRIPLRSLTPQYCEMNTLMPEQRPKPRRPHSQPH